MLRTLMNMSLFSEKLWLHLKMIKIVETHQPVGNNVTIFEFVEIFIFLFDNENVLA